MKVYFTDNLERKLITALQLDSAPIQQGYFAIAFVKRAGLARLAPYFEDAITHGGSIEFIAGLDFRTTDPQSLSELRRLSALGDFKFYCFSEPSIDNSPTFHPKLYILKQPEGNVRAIVGSSNLSKGGLTENVEVNAVFEGMESEDFVAELYGIYRRIRQQDTLFIPDEDYITRYRRVYKRVQDDAKRSYRSQEISVDIQHLRAREVELPGTVPTQVGLIIEAIKQCTKDAQGFVRLKAIQAYVHQRALELGIAWDFSTLHNSVRGRLNEHSIGKGGKDLFVRRLGEGRYKLSKDGEIYKGR